MNASPTQPTRRRSFASLGGYSSIAQRLGTKLCDCGSWVTRTGRERYTLFNHDAGFTAYRMGVIHWRDRPVTRRGLYHFLKLVATTRIPPQRLHRGTYIWLLNVTAYKLARELGVRLPRESADKDRARVRLWLTKNEAPKEVREWSRP